MTVAQMAKAGSSPLARGLPRRRRVHLWQKRIIPARAGFTRASPTIGGNSKDHPRSRGVYRRHPGRLRRLPGSSPLARGLPRRSILARLRDGIIPARAGFTPDPREVAPAGGDHPRSRGVYLYCASLPLTRKGSSPLARGLPWAHESDFDTAGIIPARAGFTVTRGTAVDASKDHPRSRGVYGCRTSDRCRGGGSSPLARGLRPSPAISRRRPGSSPLARGLLTDE